MKGLPFPAKLNFSTRGKNGPPIIRKEKGLTQKELANQIGSSHAQLNKYESGLNTPPLHSQRLIQRFQAIEEFETDERETIIKVLDAMITKHNMAPTMKAMEG